MSGKVVVVVETTQQNTVKIGHAEILALACIPVSWGPIYSASPISMVFYILFIVFVLWAWVIES